MSAVALTQIYNSFRKLRLLGGLLMLLWGCVPTTFAHPISISSAVVDVYTNKVTAELNIMTEDLVLFHELKAGEDFKFSAEQLKEASKKHTRFLLDFFTVLDAKGNKLSGHEANIDTAQIDEEGLYPADLMSYSVVYLLEFPLEAPQDFITISQNFGGDDSALPSMMDILVLQQGQFVEEPVQVGPRIPHSVSFDWVNGPPEPPTDWKDLAERRERKSEKQLGITSYSGLYSYIYIERYEVRHEILIPALTFETLVPLAREDKDFLSVAEQEAARASVEAYFREHCPVIIDGVEVKPVLDRLDFYGLDFRDFALRPEARRVSMYQARMGVILSYSTKGAPGSVRMIWDSFNQHLPFVKSHVYVYDRDAEKHYFEPANSEFNWQASDYPELGSLAEAPVLSSIPPPPAMPTLTLHPVGWLALGAAIALAISAALVKQVVLRKLCMLGFAGALAGTTVGWHIGVRDVPHPFKPVPEIPADEAGAVFASLHRNVYRAFDYLEEGDVYDALDRSVTGDLLNDLYLQIQEGLKMQEQGGAVSRIREVEITDASLLPREIDERVPHFSYRVTWTVRGTVEHWGHIHTRVNEFQADFLVKSVNREWKITDFEVNSQKRLKFDTGLRKVKS